MSCRVPTSSSLGGRKANRDTCRGGNDPAVVFEDVDIDDVASKIATFSFLNSGQVSQPV